MPSDAVGPGATRTHALSTVLTPEIERVMLAHTPIRRLGEPEDIAGAALYFGVPISGWVSGQVLFVNGGGVQTLELEWGEVSVQPVRSPICPIFKQDPSAAMGEESFRDSGAGLA
ncbi:hypothetical protein DESA109040_19095 [Deinococcus saxicola]|uniref:SDR family oxidoreductase n=1 Tax=Deinococcus saxicola TaxID=249406 RepID=UPI0039EE3E93